MHSSNPYFHVKVMFTMDNALQSHWRSSSSATDRPSVNDNILRMSDMQDSILRLNFNQMLPKLISDKVLVLINANKDEKEKVRTFQKLSTHNWRSAPKFPMLKWFVWNSSWEEFVSSLVILWVLKTRKKSTPSSPLAGRLQPNQFFKAGHLSVGSRLCVLKSPFIWVQSNFT